MHENSKLTTDGETRRKLLQCGCLLTLFHSTGLLSGVSAKTTESYSGDLAILNVALGLEHKAIAACRAGEEGSLLTGQSLESLRSFGKDHKRHRDSIIKLIKRFGGVAVEPEQHYDFGSIKSAGDLLQFAHDLEQEAVDTYLANASKLQSSVIVNSAVAILVDEVCHVTSLKLALGLPITVRPQY